MRYQLLAFVHGSVESQGEAGNSVRPRGVVPAIVEFVGSQVRKRAVAVIETGRRLNAGEVSDTATQLCRRLQGSFARHGLTLSDPELIER